MAALGLLRFMRRGEVISKYQIPRHVQEELFKDMPVACMSDGTPLYFEGQVDAFLQERFPYGPAVAPYQRVESARPRGGRRATTEHEAVFARDLKDKGKAYCEIVPLLRAEFPKRADFFTEDNTRKCIERHEKRLARQGRDRTNGIDP